MWRTLRDLNARDGDWILLRADLNVPITEDGVAVADDFRIRAVLPTIQRLRQASLHVALLSHLGEPASLELQLFGSEDSSESERRGKPAGETAAAFSLQPVAEYLTGHLGVPVPLVGIGGGWLSQAKSVQAKHGIMLLENLRFHEGEERNDPKFAAELAQLGSAYVNDAFGVSHRTHASVVAITRHLPSYAGPLLEREVKVLGGVLENPARPLTLVIGGSKIATKMPLIERFLGHADHVLVGGALVGTILAARGIEVGTSLVDRDSVASAQRLMPGKRGLELPTDLVVSSGTSAGEGVVRDAEAIRPGEAIRDIGPRTGERFAAFIRGSKTVVWNGPLGLFEQLPYARGTEVIAQAVAQTAGYTVVGGGDTDRILLRLGLRDRINHLSTGGGAMLDFLAGERLPGLAALGYYQR